MQSVPLTEFSSGPRRFGSSKPSTARGRELPSLMPAEATVSERLATDPHSPKATPPDPASKESFAGGAAFFSNMLLYDAGPGSSGDLNTGVGTTFSSSSPSKLPAQRQLPPRSCTAACSRPIDSGTAGRAGARPPLRLPVSRMCAGCPAGCVTGAGRCQANPGLALWSGSTSITVFAEARGSSASLSAGNESSDGRPTGGAGTVRSGRRTTSSSADRARGIPCPAGALEPTHCRSGESGRERLETRRVSSCTGEHARRGECRADKTVRRGDSCRPGERSTRVADASNKPQRTPTSRELCTSAPLQIKVLGAA
mmetsp:Transcript_141198/g.316607  ORF Transcript_141198/g.316607 Transcript_141198/m.316607 type:complete len:312 (+) Transcript_141198:767-1702(+)